MTGDGVWRRLLGRTGRRISLLGVIVAAKTHRDHNGDGEQHERAHDTDQDAEDRRHPEQRAQRAGCRAETTQSQTADNGVR